MTFWLSRIDRIILNCFYFVLPTIIITNIKLYLSYIFIYPPFANGILLQQ